MSQPSQIIIYKTEDGKISVNALMQEESLWLNAHQMAELFEIDRSGVVKHLKNIYETRELEKKLTCAKIAQVAKDGKERLSPGKIRSILINFNKNFERFIFLNELEADF